MANLRGTRSLFYWVRDEWNNTTKQTEGYWIEATIGGLATETVLDAGGGLASNETVLTVDSASSNNIISVGDRINLGIERLYVTGRSGQDLTVTRAFDGTPALAHSNNAKITIGTEAINNYTLIDALHNPKQLNIELLNTSDDIFSSTGSSVEGKLTNVFSQLQNLSIETKNRKC